MIYEIGIFVRKENIKMQNFVQQYQRDRVLLVFSASVCATMPYRALSDHHTHISASGSLASHSE